MVRLQALPTESMWGSLVSWRPSKGPDSNKRFSMCFAEAITSGTYRFMAISANPDTQCLMLLFLSQPFCQIQHKLQLFKAVVYKYALLYAHTGMNRVGLAPSNER